MDTDIFIIHIESEDIANNVDKWFDTSGYDKNDDRPLTIGINKKYQECLRMNYMERLR